MAGLPRPEVTVCCCPQTDKGFWEDRDMALFAAKVIRDGKVWSWVGRGTTNAEALKALVVAMLDDPMTAEFVKEG